MERLCRDSLPKETMPCDWTVGLEPEPIAYRDLRQ